MRSRTEREIRDAVVHRLRAYIPTARIVHELNCSGGGSCRMDVAAITPDDIVGVEIKSERDTLERLKAQVAEYDRTFRVFILAVHESHVPELLELMIESKVSCQVWIYPDVFSWDFDFRYSHNIPRSNLDMLRLLWRDELYAECALNGVVVPKRANITRMLRDMSMGMTGRQILRAVCRQLRQRKFAEADPPIAEEREESA